MPGGMGGMVGPFGGPGIGGNPGIFMNMNPIMNPAMWTNIYNNPQMNNNTNNANVNTSFGLPMGNKINVVFKTTMGVITNVLIDFGKTMSELFQVYLKKVDKIELFNTKNTILFLFNAKKISFTDETKVEQFFNVTPHPTIVVNDVRGLIGA